MKKLISCILLLLVLVVLTACGGNTESQADSNSNAEYADEVVFAYHQDLDSANPYGGTSAQTSWYTNATFRSLVWTNYETGELEPQLALSWDDVNGDSTVWQLKLREGVKFHDNTEFNADDVVFTWNYAKDATKVVKPIASADVMVKEVKAIDDYTVEFDLNYPIPDFISYLELKMFSKEAFDTMPEKDAAVIGCGPYKVGQLVSGVSFSLDRFDDYYEGIDQFPTKTITFKVVKDEDVVVTALQTGEADASIWFPSTAIPSLEADKNINIYTCNGCQSYYYGFNYRHEVWKDLNMRKALCEALNKEDIVTLAYEDTATVNNNFCIPTGKGYVDVKSIEYNPDDAKALLEQCGKVGQEVKIMYSGTVGKTIATVVQDELNQVGFKAVLDEVDGTNWTELKGTGDYDIFVGDYCSYTGALLYNFDRFFSIGGSSNVYGFESQEWEDLIADARQCKSYDEMLEKFAECQQWAADNIPIIPIAINKSFYAARVNVGGLKAAPSLNLVEVYRVYKTK